ncbi:biliverdin-producing heme oxygenase [Tianweitania sediminis]
MPLAGDVFKPEATFCLFQAAHSVALQAWSSMFGSMNQAAILDFPLSRRLKTATAEAHAGLDARIMKASPFASRERYGRFLQMQHGFHRDVADIYADERIAVLLPDLRSRCRLADIEADRADLGLDLGMNASSRPSPGEGLGERLGWLYVAEGSNLGAAFLIKEAAKLGLNADFGARHLAGHPDGRGLQWRRFQEAMDGAGFGEAEEAHAIAGACAAFARVRLLADQAFSS